MNTTTGISGSDDGSRSGRPVRVRTAAVLVLYWVAMLSAGHAESPEPTSVPPEPVLTLTKDAGAGDVVLTWTATTGPYSVTRSTDPNFGGSIVPQIIAAGVAATTYRDHVLNDGINYYYSVEDANTTPRVYTLSATSGLPGASVTLTGIGFSSVLAENEVFITGVPAIVTGVTNTTLTFIVPSEAVTGNVVVSSPNGSDEGHLFYVVGCCVPGAVEALTDVSSVAVDAAHISFLADRVAGKVYSFDTAGTLSQRGTLTQAIGLPTDTSSPNKVYYGDATGTSANFGTIKTTTNGGSEALFNQCGDTTSGDNCWVWAIGLDPNSTDFGAQGRVYVADRATTKVRIVPPAPGFATDFASPGTLLSSPRGIVVDRNSSSPFFKHVFVSTSSTVKRYDNAVPGNLLKTYDSTNSPVSNPGQVAVRPAQQSLARDERLLVADRGQNRVVVINPATDKSKTIDIALTSPRGIAVDTDLNGAVFAYVAEQTRVLKMPVYKTVFVVAWVADGAPITDQEVRDQIAVANRTLAACGFEVQLRNNAVNHFAAGNLLDLQINNWATTYCRNTSPTLLRTGDEVALLDAPARRSNVQTDVNVYFVRSFTIAGGSEPRSVAETVTRDCFIAEGMMDEANSGIIFSAKKLRKYGRQTTRTLAHELGHALLDITVWGDEHTPMAGGSYPATNVMSIPATAKRRGFEDPDQCLVINQDLTIFRGDP